MNKIEFFEALIDEQSSILKDLMSFDANYLKTSCENLFHSAVMENCIETIKLLKKEKDYFENVTLSKIKRT